MAATWPFPVVSRSRSRRWNFDAACHSSSLQKYQHFRFDGYIFISGCPSVRISIRDSSWNFAVVENFTFAAKIPIIRSLYL